MYQKLLRDPGGSQLVRVISDTVVVNGSVLMVPAGCVAYFVCNGLISEPYPPGAWTVNTGLSPFFVRLRNLMTRGEPPLSVSVFFINNERENFFRMGTGEVPFSEKKHNLTMRALASISLRFSIHKPLAFLRRLIGMHMDAFDQEDLDRAFESMLNAAVKTQLAQYLHQCEYVTALHNDLTGLSRQMSSLLRTELDTFGIRLSTCNVDGINLVEEDLAALRKLEVMRAEGSVRTDVEAENLRKVYGSAGNGIDKRILSEMMTGINHTPLPGQTSAAPPAAGGGMSSLLPFLLLPNLATMFQRPLQDLMQQGNLFDQSGQTSASRSEPEENAGPPPLPRSVPTKLCPQCGRVVQTRGVRCPHCGRSLS